MGEAAADGLFDDAPEQRSEHADGPRLEGDGQLGDAVFGRLEVGCQRSPQLGRLERQRHPLPDEQFLGAGGAFPLPTSGVSTPAVPGEIAVIIVPFIPNLGDGADVGPGLCGLQRRPDVWNIGIDGGRVAEGVSGHSGERSGLPWAGGRGTAAAGTLLVVGRPTIRDATAGDLARITEIYNWTIVDSHVSFDAEPYDDARRQAWWDDRSPDQATLVAEMDGEVAGVAYSSWYKPKAGYRSSRETTVVVDEAHRGRGIGTELLAALLDRLAGLEVHRAIAIVALPNDASVALHHRVGYRTVGVLTEVGEKSGRYWDTVILERAL